MFGWFSKKTKEEIELQKKWNISARDAIKKYGSATAVMLEIFKDDQVIGLPLEQLIIQYLKEEYLRKNPE